MKSLLILSLFTLIYGQVSVLTSFPPSGTVVTRPITNTGAFWSNLVSTSLDVRSLSLTFTCDGSTWNTPSIEGFVLCPPTNNTQLVVVVYLNSINSLSTSTGSVTYNLTELSFSPLTSNTIYNLKYPTIGAFPLQDSIVDVSPTPVLLFNGIAYYYIRPNSDFNFTTRAFPNLSAGQSISFTQGSNGTSCANGMCYKIPTLVLPSTALVVVEDQSNMALSIESEYVLLNSNGSFTASVYTVPNATYIPGDGVYSIPCFARGAHYFTAINVSIEGNKAEYTVNGTTSQDVAFAGTIHPLDCAGASQITVKVAYLEIVNVTTEGTVQASVGPQSAVIYNIPNPNNVALMYLPDEAVLSSQGAYSVHGVDNAPDLDYYLINPDTTTLQLPFQYYTIAINPVTTATSLTVNDRWLAFDLVPSSGNCLVVDIRSTIYIYECPGDSFVSSDAFSSSEDFYYYVCSQHCQVILQPSDVAVQWPILQVPISSAGYDQNVTTAPTLSVYRFPSAALPSLFVVQTSANSGLNGFSAGPVDSVDSNNIVRGTVGTASVYAAFKNGGSFTASLSAVALTTSPGALTASPGAPTVAPTGAPVIAPASADNSLSRGAIAGIVIGVVAAAAIIAAIAFYLGRRGGAKDDRFTTPIEMHK